MKRLLFICSFIAAGATAWGQAGCSRTLPLFRFDQEGTPEKVYTLGTNPQFTFLKGQGSPAQFLSAVMKAQKDARYKKGINEFNSLMMEIGFENGIQDLKQAAITSENIPAGTIGKMGNGKYVYQYTQLAGAQDFPAWKITSDKGCYAYVLKKCGNAFYPESAAKEVQPVAMLETSQYEGNMPEAPKPEVKEEAPEVPKMPVARRMGPEDCYCKFRSMYKSFYPYHSRGENRIRRKYVGDYPRYCTTDGCGYCKK